MENCSNCNEKLKIGIEIIYNGIEGIKIDYRCPWSKTKICEKCGTTYCYFCEKSDFKDYYHNECAGGCGKEYCDGCSDKWDLEDKKYYSKGDFGYCKDCYLKYKTTYKPKNMFPYFDFNTLL